MPYKELLKISIPTVIVSISTSLINLVTISITGSYSIESIAAISTFFSINTLFYNVFLASFSGYRILGSKAFGNEDFKEINYLFNNNIVITLIFAFLISIILYVFSTEIVSLITKDHNVINIAANILKISAWSYPFQSIILNLNISLALQKQTKINMYITLTTTILGVLIIYLTVHGTNNLSGLGTLGIGWAILIQSVLSCLIYLILFSKFSIKFLYYNSVILKQCLKLWKLSYPSVISMFIDYLNSFIIFSMISNYFGNKALASGRLGFTFSLQIFSIIVSLSSGFYILGGRALGNKNNIRFMLYYKCNIYMTMLCVLIISLMIIAMPITLLQIFTQFNEIQELSYFPLIIVAIYSPLAALSYNNALYLRLIEKVKTEAICNGLSIWIIQLPIAYYLAVNKNWQINGFFVAFLCYEIFYFLSTYYFVKCNPLKT